MQPEIQISSLVVTKTVTNSAGTTGRSYPAPEVTTYLQYTALSYVTVCTTMDRSGEFVPQPFHNEKSEKIRWLPLQELAANDFVNHPLPEVGHVLLREIDARVSCDVLSVLASKHSAIRSIALLRKIL